MSSSSASSSKDEEPVNDSCPICANETPIMPYQLVNCRHVFCKDCLFQKRRITNGDPRCPMCRTVSFIAKAVHVNEHIDLGHKVDKKQMREWKITDEEIAQATVCMRCLKGHHRNMMVLCDTCEGVCHIFCAIEPLIEAFDDQKNPVRWTCPGCTASLRSKEGAAPVREFFAQLARAKRAESVRDDDDSGGESKAKTKKRANSTCGEDAVSFSGHHLGKGNKFFKSKRKSVGSVPRSGGADSPNEDEDDEEHDEFDNEFVADNEDL